jgi:hypothetical protein
MRRWALAATVAVLAAVAAPAHGAGWLAPTRVTTSGEIDAGPVAVAVNPDGSAVAAWGAKLPDNSYAVRVAHRPAGGAFENPVNAVTNGSQFPAVAVATNPHGDVLLAWTTSGGPGAALSVRRAGGPSSPRL